MKPLIALLLILLSSCAATPKKMGTHLQKVAQELPKEYQSSQEPNSEVITGLLDLFGDQNLKDLIREALDHNLQIALSREHMYEAGFLQKMETRPLLPQLDAKFSSQYSKTEPNSGSTSYNPSLDVHWEIDIWGKLRDKQTASLQQWLSKQELHQAMQDSIAAQTMQAWFELVRAQKDVELEKLRIASLEKSSLGNQRKYLAGLGNFNDLIAINRNTAQARASLCSKQQQLHQSQRSLQILLGRYPKTSDIQSAKLPVDIALVQSGIPANLMSNRPDLRAAWHQIKAADATALASHKELYPSLSLSGSLGRSSSNFSNLFNGGNIWSIAGNITAPIFNNGKLTNQQFAATSRAKQALIKYQQTLQNALKEVEQALDREQLYHQQELEQQQAVLYGEQTATIFRKRYQNGLVTILDYLQTEDALYLLRTQLINTRTNRLKNRVALALAIGKGV